jgi:hypothetical protein
MCDVRCAIPFPPAMESLSKRLFARNRTAGSPHRGSRRLGAGFPWDPCRPETLPPLGRACRACPTGGSTCQGSLARTGRLPFPAGDPWETWTSPQGKPPQVGGVPSGSQLRQSLDVPGRQAPGQPSKGGSDLRRQGPLAGGEEGRTLQDWYNFGRRAFLVLGQPDDKKTERGLEYHVVTCLRIVMRVFQHIAGGRKEAAGPARGPVADRLRRGRLRRIRATPALPVVPSAPARDRPVARKPQPTGGA